MRFRTERRTEEDYDAGTAVYQGVCCSSAATPLGKASGSTQPSSRELPAVARALRARSDNLPLYVLLRLGAGWWAPRDRA